MMSKDRTDQYGTGIMQQQQINNLRSAKRSQDTLAYPVEMQADVTNDSLYKRTEYDFGRITKEIKDVQEGLTWTFQK